MENTVLWVNMNDNKGLVRRMNGVGGGPVTYNFSYDASAFFKEARIPFSRTHDIEYPYGSGEFVDIHNIFPDFDKDENDPANYNFIPTDQYLKYVDAVGTKPLYRLGSSIEHQPIKRYVHPPKDFAKWGRICSRIIAHYNNGWADGMNLGIEYWEIWNEPDIGAPCWTGTDEQILELYSVAATMIKKEHPDVKIGGLAFANPTGKLVDLFLSYCREHEVPLDFVSWHAYIRCPEETAYFAQEIHKKMAEYGFSDKESIFDEWNYVKGWGPELESSIAFHKTAGEAAFMGAVMSVAQDNGVDIACYYDAQMLMERTWNGLFEPGPRSGHENGGKSLKALPGFYALKYWGMLYGLSTLSCTCDNPSIYATSAISEDIDRIRILISNFSDRDGYGVVQPEAVEIEVQTDKGGYEVTEGYITDSYGNNQAICPNGNRIVLRGYAVAIITLRKKH